MKWLLIGLLLLAPVVQEGDKPKQEEEKPHELAPKPDPPEDWEGPIPDRHDKTKKACDYFGWCLPTDAEGVAEWNEENPGKKGYSCPTHALCQPTMKEHANTCFVADEDGRVKKREGTHAQCGAHCHEQCCFCCGSP